MTNAFLNGGLAKVVALLAASTLQHIGWGTGTTAVALADTGLETAAPEARTSGTKSSVTTVVADDTFQVTGAITCAGSGKSISEVALFDASSGGNCGLRSQFSAVALNIGESIEFTIQVQFVNSVITV